MAHWVLERIVERRRGGGEGAMKRGGRGGMRRQAGRLPDKLSISLHCGRSLAPRILTRGKWRRRYCAKFGKRDC